MIKKLISMINFFFRIKKRKVPVAPSTEPVSEFPANAYFLREFTQEELNYGRTQSDYLVLDKNVNIQYPFQLRLPDYTTFDSEKVTMDHFHDKSNPTAKNVVFKQEGSKGVKFKCGILIGDKFKRDFTDPEELKNESTGFVSFDYGCQDVEFSCKESYGFMGDTVSGNQYGDGHIVWEPELTKNDDGNYYSPFYLLAEGKGDLIAVYGGVGFTRFPSFNECKLNFKNTEGVVTSVNTEYLEHVTVPAGSTHVQLEVKANDTEPAGIKRVEYIQIVQHPAHTMIIKDSYFRDHHRGSVSNVLNNTKIINNVFENTELYRTKPEFPDSTKYSVDLEDAVSNFVQFIGNTFKNKFHSILLAAVKKSVITGNNFFGNAYNLSIHKAKEVEFTHNICEGGITSVNNAEKAEVAFNEFKGGGVSGSNIHDNKFSDGAVLGSTEKEGAFNNEFDGAGWSGETNWVNVHDNTFKNHRNYFSQPLSEHPITRNKFTDTYFQNIQGNYPEVVPTFIECEFTRHEYDLNSQKANLVFNNCKFVDGVINDFYYGLMGNSSTRHFNGCEFAIGIPMIKNYNNTQGSHIHYYFKDCVFTAENEVNLYELGGYTNTIHLHFENCTVDEKIKMPDGNNVWGEAIAIIERM